MLLTLLLFWGPCQLQQFFKLGRHSDREIPSQVTLHTIWALEFEKEEAVIVKTERRSFLNRNILLVAKLRDNLETPLNHLTANDLLLQLTLYSGCSGLSCAPPKYAWKPFWN